MKINRTLFSALLFSTVLALSILGLSRRWDSERAHRQFGFLVETTEVQGLARQSGQSPLSLLGGLKGWGITGVVVNELTGDDLSSGQSGFLFGPRFSMQGASGLFPASTDEALALVGINEKKPWASEAFAYLNEKFPGLPTARKSGIRYLLLPRSVSELAKAGVIPDFEGLELARGREMPVLFRPAPCPGVGADLVVASLAKLAEKRPEIRGTLPQGLFVVGSPETGPIGEWLRENGFFLAQAEFNRQLGADKLNRVSYPALVPLHSVTTDEILGRRLSREAIVERLVRAFVERSVPLLLLRSYEMETGSRKEAFLQDLAAVKKDLQGRGFRPGWPQPYEDWPRSLAGAIAFGLVCVSVAVRLLLRFRGRSAGAVGLTEAGSVVFGGVILGFLMAKVPLLARVGGAAGSALLAAEVTLWALGQYRKPLKGLVGGLAFTVVGGLALASFFSTPQTMLRIQPFSGVKATLLLPPLIVLAHDLKRRIYPESFKEVMLRPMVWVEFLLVGLILAAAALLALRSDNTAFVGGWERDLRDLLERALVARPRTKELFIGYPALVLWYAMARKNWGRHAWILPRAAASIAFASAVNSFCHFHTRLPFTLFRVFNGWWTGILLGFALLAVMRFAVFPLLDRWRSAVWQ